MLIIGLTGGIGSGKTAASKRFEELGIPVIDADQLSRELVEPGSPALQQITATFGNQVLTPAGELDRAQLRSEIFQNPPARKQLENILHPAILEEMHKRLEALEAPYAVLVIPLLLETGQADLVDRILVIDAPETEQIQRVQQRDGLSTEEIRAIMASQTNRQTRLAAADDIIVNDQTLADLRQQIDHLHHKYLDISAEH